MQEQFRPTSLENNKIAPIQPEVFENISNPNRAETRNELTSETYSFFKEMLTCNGFSEFADVNEAYKTLPATQMIVRREDPKNILKLFTSAESYEVGFPDDQRYSNCVEWNPQTDGPKNISNAYLEGFTNLNSVVTVIGLEKTDEDDLIQLDDATQDFYGLNRTGVRSYKGPVNHEKVVFINLRVPGHLLPESELTDDEIGKVDDYLEAKESGKDAQPVMIHRSYIKNDSENDFEKRKEAA